jgi:NAD(P)H-hydrate epimerase
LHPPGRNRTPLILCGGGNNGGDGLAIARHLHNADATFVGCCGPVVRSGRRADQLADRRGDRSRRRGAGRGPRLEHSRDLIIDAIFGTGLTEAPRPPFGDLAKAVNDDTGAVLAVDVPSGLDCDTGKPPGDCIRANVTVTFVAEKVGFTEPVARRFLGDVVVGDIGCPLALIEEVAGGAVR